MSFDASGLRWRRFKETGDRLYAETPVPLACEANGCTKVFEIAAGIWSPSCCPPGWFVSTSHRQAPRVRMIVLCPLHSSGIRSHVQAELNA